MARTISSESLAEVVRGQTVATRFRDTVRERPDAVAIRAKQGDGWVEWTWADYADRACRLATALGDLGVTRGDRVVLMMRNRPEFHVADVAVVLCGATPISIYNSSSSEQVQYLTEHCDATIAIVEDATFLKRFEAVRDQLPLIRDIVMIDGKSDGAYSWDILMESDPVDLDEASKIAQPSDLATVIYTSGTTGPPKGVMLDHENVCFTVECLRLCLEDVGTAGRRMVSYLPMAHIAERMTSHYQGLTLGYEVTTCPEPGQVAPYLSQVHPEVFFGVPRVWEKIHAGVMASVAADPQRKAGLEAALGVGLKVSECRARGEEIAPDLHAEWEKADVALGGIRTLLGLDACLTAISGAAPISADVFDFFRALGVPISEIYGMSESSGPMTWEPFLIRSGTVGREVPGCEIRLAEDGEVICRGGNVFRGYLNDPEKTADALVDGWLLSGDIGVLDSDGYLRIVDRKKELIITAGGKNISPSEIENMLKFSGFIKEAIIVADKRHFVSALIQVDGETVGKWAEEKAITYTNFKSLAEHASVRDLVAQEVEAVNRRMPQVQHVRKFHLLTKELDHDDGEVTATMKIRRESIAAKYSGEVEAMYRS